MAAPFEGCSRSGATRCSPRRRDAAARDLARREAGRHGGDSGAVDKPSRPRLRPIEPTQGERERKAPGIYEVACAVARLDYLARSPSGRSAAWLAHLTGGQGVAGSNPVAPTGSAARRAARTAAGRLCPGRSAPTAGQTRAAPRTAAPLAIQSTERRCMRSSPAPVGREGRHDERGERAPAGRPAREPDDERHVRRHERRRTPRRAAPPATLVARHAPRSVPVLPDEVEDRRARRRPRSSRATTGGGSAS